MVAFNVSADDASPLILYSPAGAWTDSPCEDLSAPLYSQRSWHTSSSYGASATFLFNGTGIWFLGARKPGYGSYNISIDGRTVSGNAQSKELSFQQILGGRSGLSNGPHTAVFTNTGSGSVVDLDSIVFETEIYSADTVTQTTMDDTSPAITYLPKQEDWVFDNMQGWYNNTFHFTQTNGAQAQFAFNGGAIAIYGTVSPFLADYSVTTDGVTQYFRSSSQGLASSVHLDTLLYFASSLTSGSHNLTLTANPARDGQHNTSTLMDIDRIVVFNASNFTTNEDDGNITLSTVTGTPQQPVQNTTLPTIIGIPQKTLPLTGLQNLTNPVDDASQRYFQQHSSKQHKIAAIIGGIAGLILLLLLILVALLLFRRRRPQKHSLNRIFSVRRTPKLPMQPPPVRKLTISSPIRVEEDSSDLESIIAPYTIPLGPNESPFMDDAHLKLPWLPETCVTRDECNGRSGEFQVECKAWPRTPIRRLRPPSLHLAPLRE